MKLNCITLTAAFTLIAAMGFAQKNANDVVSKREIMQDFFVAAAVNITEVHNDISLKVYPNPTNGQLRITYSGTGHAPSAQIYDVVGNLLQSKIVNLQSEIEVDISHFPAGLYFLKVDGKVLKVVKK